MIEDMYAVFDSGPLIHLSEMGAIALLDLFKQKATTDIVISEAGRHISPEARSYLQKILAVYPYSDKLQSEKLSTLARIYSLDYGEITTLAVCDTLRSKGKAIFFSDDSAARMAAEGLGIDSVGTIGILVKSATLGMIGKTRAIELIESIPDVSTLHIRRDLLKSIADRLRKEWSLE